MLQREARNMVAQREARNNGSPARQRWVK